MPFESLNLANNAHVYFLICGQADSSLCCYKLDELPGVEV